MLPELEVALFRFFPRQPADRPDATIAEDPALVLHRVMIRPRLATTKVSLVISVTQAGTHGDLDHVGDVLVCLVDLLLDRGAAGGRERDALAWPSRLFLQGGAPLDDPIESPAIVGAGLRVRGEVVAAVWVAEADGEAAVGRERVGRDRLA